MKIVSCAAYSSFCFDPMLSDARPGPLFLRSFEIVRRHPTSTPPTIRDTVAVMYYLRRTFHFFLF